MKNLKFKAYASLLVFSVTSILSLRTLAGVERIKSMRFDKSKVETVFVSAGLATVMIFPCEINEAVVGNEQALKAVVSPTTKKQLTLFLGSRESLSTNLIVRCGGKTDPFVFDLISNKSKHQDVLKVGSNFGAPRNFGDMSEVLMDASDSKLRNKKIVIEIRPPELIGESK